MKYGEKTAARLGKSILTFTPTELGRMFSEIEERKILVRQAPYARQSDDILMVCTRNLFLAEVSLNRRGQLRVVGMMEVPWSAKDARLVMLLNRRFSMLLRHAHKGLDARPAWHRAKRRGVEVQEARLQGKVLGRIEPVGRSYALIVEGEQVGARNRSPGKLKHPLRFNAERVWKDA